MWPFLTVWNCITTEHDLRLVVLAALLCLLASTTAMSMISRARAAEGRMRQLMEERHPIYALADVKVESRDVPHDRVTQDMLETLDAWLAAEAGGASAP